ncbi:rRNA small subunit methyltransferase G [Musa troglodytarum]|uniref:rRNA small subunit methyltransferase G n=1 Tax=Musa troglodytarum TaxID=320322 RepID=A0A9E7GV94_9LILI|nr:rRNA small subunit methyltransferase G [Musa troglodytarum]
MTRGAKRRRDGARSSQADAAIYGRPRGKGTEKRETHGRDTSRQARKREERDGERTGQLCAQTGTRLIPPRDSEPVDEIMLLRGETLMVELAFPVQDGQSLEDMPIAVETDKAKSQHYELPTSFFKLVLGENLKYSPFSCCYFKNIASTLEDAENAMLELYSERAQLKDGQKILDVGCGWGSFVIYIAKKYKNCSVTGICNSSTQKTHIEEQCSVLIPFHVIHGHTLATFLGFPSCLLVLVYRNFDLLDIVMAIQNPLGHTKLYLIFSLQPILKWHLQLSNVEIIVADIAKFEMEASFDRVVSIGMFEYMKNYKMLLKKILMWMKQDSLLFIKHFCHKTFAYHFEDKNEDDWITRYFFTGGTMPSANLLLYFQATYGKDSATKWIAYWRTFFISVAEIFGFNNGDEWMVALFLLKKK